MAVRFYNTMPDEETVRRITAMGDTIELTSGAAPTASAGTGYVAPRRESTFLGDPALTTNDPNAARDPAFGTAQVASAREWIADTAYRNAEQEFNQLVANYNRNLQENPRAFQPGGAMYGQGPPTFESVLARQRSNIEGGATMDFTGSADRYGIPQYTAPGTAAQTNTITSAGAFNPGVQASQPATTAQATAARTGSSYDSSGRAQATSGTGDWAAQAMGAIGGTDWRTDPGVTSTPTSSRFLLPNSPRVTATSGPSTPDPNTQTIDAGSSGYGAASRFLQPFQQPGASTPTNPLVTTPNYSWMNPSGISTTNLGSTDPRTGNVYTPETPGGNGEGGTTVTGGQGGGNSATNDILGRVMSLMQQNGYGSGAGYDIVAHYYSQITGFPAPPPEALGITNRNAPITASQLFSAMSNAGYNPATGQRNTTPTTPVTPPVTPPTGPPGTPPTGPPSTPPTTPPTTPPVTPPSTPPTSPPSTPPTTPGSNIPPANTVPGTGPGGGGPGTIPGGGNFPPGQGNTPGTQPSGTGTWPSGHPPYTGSAIDQMAQNDRVFGIGRGDALDTELTQAGARRENEYANWTRDLWQSYNTPFGFNDEERGYILPGTRLDSLGLTDAELANLQFTEAEQNSIRNAGTSRDENGNLVSDINSRLTEGTLGVEGAVDAYQSRLFGGGGSSGGGGFSGPQLTAGQIEQIQQSLTEAGVTNPNYDQIAYYYQQITGQAAPPPESLGISGRGAGMTPQSFASALGQAAANTNSGGSGLLAQQDAAVRGQINRGALGQTAGISGDITGALGTAATNIRAATAPANLQARATLGSDLEAIDRATGTTVDSYLSNPNLQYSDTTRANILGDLSGGESRIRGSYDPAAMRTGADFTNRLTGIVDQNAAYALGAIDRNRLRYDLAAASRNASTLTDSAGRIRAATDTGRLSQDPALAGNVEGALSSGETGLRGTVDPGRLRVSNEFTEGYNWTPEDTQRLATQAGNVVGANARVREAALMQRANAEGNASPLALEAARNRSRISEDVAAADAITNARISGRSRELDTILGRETTRLGAEQAYSGLAGNVESELGQRRLSSTYQTEQMRQDAERARAQIQAGAESDIATRDINTTLEQEGRRLAAENAATNTELAQLNTNTSNRLGALTTGEQMRVGSEQTAGQIEAQNEQAILDRRTQTQQQMEAERARLAQTAATTRANAAQTEAQRRTGNILGAETLRTDAANTAARTISDAEAGIAGRYADARLSTEGQRIGAEQFATTAGLDAEQYLGSSRLSAARDVASQMTAARENQANRGLQAATYQTGLANDTARFLATNRQNTATTGQQTQYNQGLGIYQAGAQAGQTVGNARMSQQEGYRSRLSDLATNASQNATVANQQRVTNFGTQGGVQNTATGNAIRNYGIPGTAEKIGGMILGALETGGTRDKPTDAIVGEAGPELIINLPAAANGGVSGKKMPCYGLGGMVTGFRNASRFNSGIPESTPGGAPIAPEDTENGEYIPTEEIRSPRRNPYWEALKGAVYSPDPGLPTTDENGELAKAQASGTARGLLLGGGGKNKGGLLSMFLPGAADGMIAGRADPQSRLVAPGVEYVNGPQVKRLGENGPDAVVPLQPGPNAKLTIDDVPELMDRYRSGAPVPRLKDGGVVESYDTPIPSRKKKEYDSWLKAESTKQGRDISRDQEDYDIQGYFLSGEGSDARGHGTDRFKKPNHPTFSEESQYSRPGVATQGGKWEDTGGKSRFYGSMANMKNRSPEEMRNYFKEVEPDTEFVMPPMDTRKRPSHYADGGIVGEDDRKGFDWFGLETMRKLSSRWSPEEPKPASAPEPGNMDVVRDSVRKQMESQKKQGARQNKGGIAPPPTASNKRKETRP